MNCSSCADCVPSPKDSTLKCCTHPLAVLVSFAGTLSGITLKTPSKSFPFHFEDGLVETCKHYVERRTPADTLNIASGV